MTSRRRTIISSRPRTGAKVLLGSSLVFTAVLAGCWSQSSPSATGGVSSLASSSVPVPVASSSLSSVVQVSYEGVIKKADVSIYMEGTHRLYTDNTGALILLQSHAISLDDYLNSRVLVTGTAQPTAESGGTIVTVTDVQWLGAASSEGSGALVPVLSSSETSSSSSVLPSSAASSEASSRSKSSSSRPAASSSSRSSSSQSSMASSAGSAQGGSSLADSRARTMAKAKVDAADFTQEYCSRHVSFCIPLHRNWYYVSFGATTTYLWHLEVSSEEIDNLGDGPLIVNLVSGSLDPSIADGSVVQQGDFVIGYRAWTNGRHFEITAPAILKTAVQFITQNLSVYQPADTQQDSSTSVSSAPSAAPVSSASSASSAVSSVSVSSK